MKEARSYHHGNLRQALIDAALAVVARDGYQALSLRDLAQAVNVTRGAPYRHFTDRDALLRAVASEGFRMLIHAHEQVLNHPGDAREKLLANGRVFLAFTEQHPGLFLLMYDSGLLEEAGESDELGGLLRGIYDQIGKSMAAVMQDLDESSLQARLVAMWSTLYGYARLRQSRMLKPYMLGDLTMEQAEAAVIAAAFGPLPK